MSDDESDESEQVDYFARNDDDFSKMSTDWLTLGDLIKIEEGEVSLEEFLRLACVERGLTEPTADELEQFAASFAAQQEEMRNEVAIWASNSQPLKDLQKRLQSFDVGKFPAIESEIAKVSKTMAAAVEMTNSPVFEAARTAIDSSAVRAAQRVFNDPATKAAMEAVNSPVVRQQIDDARRKITPITVGKPVYRATLSKPPYDPTPIRFDPGPSTFSAVRDMHEALVAEQSTANESLNNVADLLNVLVLGAAEADKSQRDAEGRQLAWNERFKTIYVATRVVAIIAAVAAVVSIVVTVIAA